MPSAVFAVTDPSCNRDVSENNMTRTFEITNLIAEVHGLRHVTEQTNFDNTGDEFDTREELVQRCAVNNNRINALESTHRLWLLHVGLRERCINDEVPVVRYNGACFHLAHPQLGVHRPDLAQRVQDSGICERDDFDRYALLPL